MANWIIVDDCEYFIAKCSKCGHQEDSRLVSNIDVCPNCKAKMEDKSPKKQNALSPKRVKLYFAEKKETKGSAYIAVTSAVADDAKAVYRIKHSNGGIQIVDKKRVGKKHDVCAVGRTKEEAVMLFFEGVREMADFLEKKATQYKEILEMPVEDEC